MKISLKSETGTVILGDDANKAAPINAFSREQTRVSSRRPLCQREYTKGFAKKNRTNVIQFTVERDHGTREKAVLFTMNHPEEVPLSGVLIIEQSSGTGTARKTMTDAIVESVKLVNICGVSTVFQYVISGGEMK